jgi:hypothetical protein
VTTQVGGLTVRCHLMDPTRSQIAGTSPA